MIVCFTTCEYLFLILVSVIHEYCKRISDIIANLVAQFELTQFKGLHCNLLIFEMSSERYEKVKGLIMAEGNSMSEEVKAEDKDGYLGEDKREQAFVLLLKVTLANVKPLPIGGFTNRAMAQMLYKIAGVTPRDVVIVTDQDVVIELEMETPIMEVSREVHGLYQWAGQSITVDSAVARRESIKEIVKE